MTVLLRCRRFACHCLCLVALLATICGCHSASIEVTIDNQSGVPLQLLEVDYPSASFGTGLLAPHSQFHYRFKVQGSGPVKLQYVDATSVTRNFIGPELQEGQRGSLSITVDRTGDVTWKPLLTKKS